MSHSADTQSAGHCIVFEAFISALMGKTSNRSEHSTSSLPGAESKRQSAEKSQEECWTFFFF